MENLNFKKHESPLFEISLLTRNANGDPTGKRTFATNNAYQLSQFFLRHQGKPKKRKKRVEQIKIVSSPNQQTEAYVDMTENEIEAPNNK